MSGESIPQTTPGHQDPLFRGCSPPGLPFTIGKGLAGPGLVGSRFWKIRSETGAKVAWGLQATVGFLARPTPLPKLAGARP